MDIATPHYLLFSRAHASEGGGSLAVHTPIDGWIGTIRGGRRRTRPARTALELLTVIRALESLDQPSQVTLMGCSDYIRNGIQYGLAEWQSNGWRWEHFRQMMPIKNGDLWQRMERALRFHQIGCCRRTV